MATAAEKAKQAAIAKRNSGSSSLVEQIDKMIPQLQMALPAGMDAHKMARICRTEVQKNPRLAQCTPTSFFGSIMTAAQLGLEFGAIGMAYLVPYKTTCQLIIGYKGIAELVYRSGKVSLVKSVPIYESETFEWDGIKVTNHKPLPPKQRGENLVAVYSRAIMSDKNTQDELMWVEEIDAIRDRSKAKADGPWVTDYVEMAKKTVLKRLCKTLPLSVEAKQAISKDETVRMDITEDPVNIYEISDEVEDAKESEKSA